MRGLTGDSSRGNLHGIYCRPVCRVRTPRRENCQFFALAAQAEQRVSACLRCRPNWHRRSAPQRRRCGPWSRQDAAQILAHQAAQWLDEPTWWNGNADGAMPLHGRWRSAWRERTPPAPHFEAHWGVSPLQYLQTRRLLMAKRLLTDTALPVAQVAHLSGFASVRRFNARLCRALPGCSRASYGCSVRNQRSAAATAGAHHDQGRLTGRRMTWRRC